MKGNEREGNVRDGKRMEGMGMKCKEMKEIVREWTGWQGNGRDRNEMEEN